MILVLTLGLSIAPADHGLPAIDASSVRQEAAPRIDAAPEIRVAVVRPPQSAEECAIVPPAAIRVRIVTVAEYDTKP
jgi:hypothetical protein